MHVNELTLVTNTGVDATEISALNYRLITTPLYKKCATSNCYGSALLGAVCDKPRLQTSTLLLVYIMLPLLLMRATHRQTNRSAIQANQNFIQVNWSAFQANQNIIQANWRLTEVPVCILHLSHTVLGRAAMDDGLAFPFGRVVDPIGFL